MLAVFSADRRVTVCQTGSVPGSGITILTVALETSCVGDTAGGGAAGASFEAGVALGRSTMVSLPTTIAVGASSGSRATGASHNVRVVPYVAWHHGAVVEGP